MGRHAGIDAATTRAKILDGTISLVSRKGYVATSMSDLAAEIGQTQGALYWHFKSKEDLLVAAVEELQRRMMIELAKAGGGAFGAGEGAAGTLSAMVARVAEVAEGFPTYFRFFAVVTAEAIETSPKLEAAVRRAYDGVATIVEGLFREASRENAVGDDLDFEVAARLFLGMYMGGILHQRLFRRKFPAHRAFPALVRMMDNSVAPRSTKAIKTSKAIKAIKKREPTRGPARGSRNGGG